MAVDFKKFVAKGAATAAASFKALMKEAQKAGFTLRKPTGSKNPLHYSKAGNPQVIIANEDGDRIYVRISEKLYENLQGDEPVTTLAEAPVYEVALDNGGFMLVVGMPASDVGLEPADIKALDKFVEPEPVEED